jgi:hypothetical protein
MENIKLSDKYMLDIDKSIKKILEKLFRFKKSKL